MDAYGKKPTLKDDNGAGIYDDTGSLSTGKQSGFTLLGDSHSMEKVAHLNRERIPERPVHSKGAGAHGYFEATRDMSQYTCACPFTTVGKKTPVFVRFSPTISDIGTADTRRDQRGFAIKMYTEDGNYDIVGLDKPVFFIRDWIKFVDLIHSQHRHPTTNLKDKTSYWDFLSLSPETMHGVLMNFTDRGTPSSYAHLDGFGVNTFMWYNKNSEYCWIKYHFKPLGGVKTFTNEEADFWSGKNPDLLTQDLFERIQSGNFPTYKAYVQILKPEQVKTMPFNPFDPTRVWPHKEFPLIEIGTLVLNKNPTNFFSEVEQVGFAPSNLIQGVGFSPDKLLQGRLLTYTDAQRYRLGINHAQLPINAPRCPMHANHRDGLMRFKDNGALPTYFPNSIEGTPAPDPSIIHVDLELEGAKISRDTIEPSDSDFDQPRVFYNKTLDDTQREHLIQNILGDICYAHPLVQYRELALFYLVNEDFARRLAEGLKLDFERVKYLASLSQEKRVKETGPIPVEATLPHSGNVLDIKAKKE